MHIWCLYGVCVLCVVCVVCVCVWCVYGVCVVCLWCVCVCVSQLQQIVSNSFQIFCRKPVRCVLRYLCVIEVQTRCGHNVAGRSHASLAKFRCVQTWALRLFKSFFKVGRP